MVFLLAYQKAFCKWRDFMNAAYAAVHFANSIGVVLRHKWKSGDLSTLVFITLDLP